MRVSLTAPFAQVPACAPLMNSRYSFGQTNPAHNPALHASDAVTTGKDKPRALVVDDVPDVTEMIALLLTYAGYDVTSANSGVQALVTS